MMLSIWEHIFSSHGGISLSLTIALDTEQELTLTTVGYWLKASPFPRHDVIKQSEVAL